MRNGFSTSSLIIILTLTSFCFVNCQNHEEEGQPDEPVQSFYFGADLSYVNQILDKGGVFSIHRLYES